MLDDQQMVIYGYEDYGEGQGVLIHVKNIGSDAVVYFNNIEDSEIRGGERLFMICVLATKIPYLTHLRILETIEKISKKVKAKEDWDPKTYWTEIMGFF